MIIIKGLIKTSEIKSCKYNYDTKKWDVQFNSGKIYAYNYENIECLKDPISLNPSMYRISRDSTEFFDIKSIYSFKSLSSTYWHICFKNGSTRDYNKEELKIIESFLKQGKYGNVFEYIKQIADLSELRNEDTGENLLFKTFNRISFIENEVALAQYLNPSSAPKHVVKQEYVPIFPFGCNNSQYMAVKNDMENQISVIQGPPGTGKTQTILNIRGKQFKYYILFTKNPDPD